MMNDIMQKELMRLRAARDLAEQKYRLITDATIDAIIITPEGKISFWNPAAERMFGYSQKEIMCSTKRDSTILKKPVKAR
jgi:PAS domain-containing protein